MSLLPLHSIAAQVHIVKPGETLIGIARKYHVSTGRLAQENGLSQSFQVIAGQRLRIPSNPADAGAARADSRARPAYASLPKSVQRAIDRAKVVPGRWRYIVIHHSGVDTGTVKGMDRYHREVRHMENGLAYHFVIGNGSGMKEGEVAVGNRWVKQLDGGHLASDEQDRVALGICLVGNFEAHPPSAKQMDALRALLQALMKRCNLTPSAVRLHRQINIVTTRCPGARFPSGFLESLKRPAG